MGSLAPSPWFTGLDNAGVTLVGAKLFTYATGGTTKLATYTDAALTIPHPNPIILDAAGRVVLYLQPMQYKFVLAPSTDSDPPSSPIKTVDPVGSVPATNINLDVTGLAAQTLPAGSSVFMSDGSSGLTTGSWYLTTQGAAQSIGASVIGFAVGPIASGATGSIRIFGRVTGLSGLATGSSYYVSSTPGALTQSPGANARLVAVADSSTSVIIAEKRAQWMGRQANFGQIGNVGSGEDVLSSYNSGANELYSDSMAWTGHFWGVTVNNANVKQLRLRVLDGVNNVIAFGPFVFTASEAGRWDFNFELKRMSATQFVFCGTCVVGPGSGPASKVGTNLIGTTTPGLATFASGVEIRLTGDATTTNDIEVYAGTMYRVN